jgi:hypothetical protein
MLEAGNLVGQAASERRPPGCPAQSWQDRSAAAVLELKGHARVQGSRGEHKARDGGGVFPSGRAAGTRRLTRSSTLTR